MCQFIDSESLMPGFLCCRCRTYNGLQRTHCRACDVEAHLIEVPPHVGQCPSCGFGYTKGHALVGNAAGQTFKEDRCPVCEASLSEEVKSV